jgi:hypothetical protein
MTRQAPARRPIAVTGGTIGHDAFTSVCMKGDAMEHILGGLLVRALLVHPCAAFLTDFGTQDPPISEPYA